MKVNDKYLYEENKYVHNFVKIYGLLNVIIGLIFIILFLVAGFPGLLIPFLLVFPILSIIIGIYLFKLKRFQITEDFVQFQDKINGYKKIEFDEIETAELLITDLKVTKREDIKLKLKDGNTLNIRMADDLNIDYFLKLKKVLYLCNDNKGVS